MEKLKHQRWIDLILIVLIIIFIVVVIYAIIIFNRDSFNCLKDPMLYFEALNNVSCQCMGKFSFG